ncbi:MAG: hypothetical protein JST79_06060 [Acidobacteria bacterium]|nr:hypothetical protein [Acidobacteriota bacterium]
MNDVPREKLRELLEKHGETLLQNPDRCEGLLKDHCAPYRREISVLVGAMKERIPGELKGSWQSSMSPEAMRARLVQRLQDDRGLAPDVADWAVGAWSYALGVNLGRQSDPVNQSLLSEPQGDVAVLEKESGGTSKEFQKQDSARKDSKEGAAAGLAQDKKKKLKIGAVAAVALVIAVIAWGRRPEPVPCANPSSNAACNTPDGKADGNGNGNDNGGNGTGGQNGDNSHGGQNVSQQAAALVGTSITIRTSQRLDSQSAVAGQTVPATVMNPVSLNGKEVIPRGAQVLLRVTRADKAGHFQGVPVLAIALTQVTMNGATYNVSSNSYSVSGKSRGKNTAVKTGVGAGAGALIGGLFGKGKGAAIGAGLGAGSALGYQAVTQADPAVIGAERTISFRVTTASPGQ